VTPRDPKNPRDGGRRAAAQAQEKPRFTITCQECGTQADVPFKPIDGRQIFCQPCYRARKGTVAAATDGAAVETTDAGIIE
jgi:CxxC-x17-CxxC domain-containing protein